MENYTLRQRALIKEAKDALYRDADYQTSAIKHKEAFEVVLEGSLKYYSKKPSKDLKRSVQKLIDSIKNQESINYLITAYNHIVNSLNPQYQNEAYLEETRNAYLSMMYYFAFPLAEIDEGKTSRAENLKKMFNNGIMTGTSCFLFTLVIVTATVLLSATLILVTNPDTTEKFEGLNLTLCIIILIIFIGLDIAVMFYPQTASLIIFTVIFTFMAYMTFKSLPMALLFATGLQLISISIVGVTKIMEILYYLVSLGAKGFIIYHIIFTETHIDPDNTVLMVICTALPVALMVGASVFMYQRKFNKDGSLYVHVQQFYKWRTLLFGLLLSSIPLFPYRQEIMDGLFITSKNAAENVYSFAMSHLILTLIVIKVLLALFRRRRRYHG